MAFCGTEINENEEEVKVDHSLKGVFAFSSIKNQMCFPQKEEGLILRGEDGKSIDRRILIDFGNAKFGLLKSYRILCQLTSRLPKGEKVVGTCFRINRNKSEYILTCAHNIVVWSTFRNKFTQLVWCVYYEMRQGESSWIKCKRLDMSTGRVHPKHNGDGASGFDIAVCHPGQIISKGKNDGMFVKYRGNADVTLCSCDPQDLSKGMSLEIAGYPGEKEGQPHTHTGVIVGWIRTKCGGHVLFYDVDCTCGNSGSPIMITDKEYLKKQKAPPGVKKMVIGIHTGHDQAEGYNFGTLITKSLEKWIDGEDYQVEEKGQGNRDEEEEPIFKCSLVEEDVAQRYKNRSRSTPVPSLKQQQDCL